MPKVGIALATYNPQLDFFRQQIRSLQEQSFKDWVCVISDDQSAPEVFLQIKKMIAEDVRFQCVQTSMRLNVVKNFENAVRHLPSDCQLIAFCDQDDIWQRHKLERLMKEFTQDDVMLAHSDLELIDEENRTLASSCWDLEKRDWQNLSVNDLIIRNVVTGCSCMFRLELLPLILPFPAQKQIHFFHDHWVALQALRKGRISSVKEPLVRYRQHGRNVVGAYQGSHSALLQKFVNLKSLLERSDKAYNQRFEILNCFLDRLRSTALSPHEERQFKEEFLRTWGSALNLTRYFIHKSMQNTRWMRVGLQVVLGSIVQGQKIKQVLL